MNEHHIRLLLDRIQSIRLSENEQAFNDTYPYYRKGFNDAVDASIRMITDLSNQVLHKKSGVPANYNADVKLKISLNELEAADKAGQPFDEEEPDYDWMAEVSAGR